MVKQVDSLIHGGSNGRIYVGLSLFLFLNCFILFDLIFCSLMYFYRIQKQGGYESDHDPY